jgi:hypothetical protein
MVEANYGQCLKIQNQEAFLNLHVGNGSVKVFSYVHFEKEFQKTTY